MSEKRYYWMKFQRDFFKSLRIKKLRRLAGGDTYTIIYLKLQLLSLTTDGFLKYKHIFESFAEELAEEIDESVENIQVTLNYLMQDGVNLMLQDGDTYFLPYAADNIGSEGASAQRVRDFRARQDEQKALHCNASVTDVKRLCNVEKEIDIEIDKEKEKVKKESRNFVPPTLSEVKAYCQERNNGINPNSFIDFYESKGWMVGKTKMKDWRAAIRTWEQRRNNERGVTNNEPEYDPKKHNFFE